MGGEFVKIFLKRKGKSRSLTYIQNALNLTSSAHPLLSIVSVGQKFLRAREKKTIQQLSRRFDMISNVRQFSNAVTLSDRLVDAVRCRERATTCGYWTTTRRWTNWWTNWWLRLQEMMGSVMCHIRTTIAPQNKFHYFLTDDFYSVFIARLFVALWHLMIGLITSKFYLNLFFL